jgi:uncharacterized protein with von Willebrand factor type A (vWA) domain
MLIDFFQAVRAFGVPASVREYLDLLRALRADLAFGNQDDFYALARTCLVKDEQHFDKFDQACALYFSGINAFPLDLEELNLPQDWLQKELDRVLSEADKANVQGLGSLDQILDAFKERLKHQKKRHQGGNKNIGTSGTSPFGHGGYNPEGIRIGGESTHQRAVKVWEKRQYRDLDDSVTIGTRNIKLALRGLREFARQGAADQLDLDDTIRSTANNAGYLDLKLVPERHNAVKVLLFFDIGGSMDTHVHICEALFSAARTEFKQMSSYYFHNCLYEAVWPNNRRRYADRVATWDLIHRYGSDYKVIFVGDASMSPYEVDAVYGSVEHHNDEPGSVWLERVTSHFRKVVWLNPMPEHWWGQGGSLARIQQLMNQRMYPLTLEGIGQAMAELQA